MDNAVELPHVDEHSARVDATAERTWAALLQVVERSMAGGAAPRFARLVGCEDSTSGGPRPLAEGSTIPGFHVGAAEEPRELALIGRHHFSRYALIFRIDALAPESARLRAETRAEFPGLRGRLYRAMVIGTRVHVLVTNRMLNATKRRAERP